MMAASLVTIAASGCASLGRHDGKPLVPARVLTQSGPYRIWTNEPIEADAPAVRELASLDRQVRRELALRPDPEAAPIEVYILDDERTYLHFLKFYYPELPARRAFFLARGDRRVVYTYFGGRLEEDLRHEATHALLNGSIPDLPLWLDEGLAEYFEVGEDREGLNREHLARLPADRAGGWAPDLAHLETLTDVREMTPRDYREAWAWAHYFLSGPEPNRAALLGYLADLKASNGAPTAGLAARLAAGDNGRIPAADGLLAYLDVIEARPTADSEVRTAASSSSSRKMVYRLQNPAGEPRARAPAERSSRQTSTPVVVVEPPPRRRGLVGAFLDLFR
jgi:hypothetical protein